jgi:nicotinamide-nucleotide amidase
VSHLVVDMEIVCIGNELLIGKVVNTNASWVGKCATSMGVTVKRITVVADDVAAMASVFSEVLARKPMFMITTGGLGPTFDDKTLQGLAKALNCPLEVNDEALQMVKEKYSTYAKIKNVPESEMTLPRIKMATIPHGTLPVTNPVGTAPGVKMYVDDTVIIVLPGVPSEMEAIFEASVVPLLRQATGDVSFYEKSVYADRIMESVLAPLIDTVMYDNPYVYIKSHPKQEEGKPHIELHFSISGKPAERPQERLNKAATELSILIGQVGGKITF